MNAQVLEVKHNDLEIDDSKYEEDYLIKQAKIYNQENK